MFGKIVQRWNIFKADLSEYRQLCRDCSVCWDEVERACNRITKLSDMASEKADCCINICVFNDSFAGPAEKFKEYVVYCESFKINMKQPHSCVNANCPYHNANREYVRAVADYRAALARRRAFWARKAKKVK